jgi:signal transduction histidine kinase/putative methionine-R-sulfoxide reductase with GAF domain
MLDVSLEPSDLDRSSETERLKAALARELRISQALREVGVALGTTLDLDDLLELILAKLTELLEADRCTLYLVDEMRGDLVSRVTMGSKVRSIRVKIGHGIAGYVAQSGKALRVSDAYKDSRFQPEWDALTGYRTTCILAAPLKNHLGRTIGVIQVLNKSGSAKTTEFTDEDEAILSALSTQAAVAIDNSRLFLSLIQKNRQLVDTKEQLEQKVGELEVLFNLERATSRSQNIDELVLAALSITAAACMARGAALIFAQGPGEAGASEFVNYVYDAEREPRIERFLTPSRDGLMGAVMQQGAAQLATAETALPLGDNWASRVHFPVASYCIVPLEGETETLGAIGVFAKQGDALFSAADQALLDMMGANVSTALRLFLANEDRERTARLTSIGRLLSQVIHDFKTPLTVISGYVQLMQNAEDRTLRVQYAQEALRQFDVLSSMQREVLEFARGERTIFVRRVYLHKFFGELRKLLAQQFDGRAIDLELDIDNKLVARFDEGRVERALHNLARNAVEAMAATGGTLRIEARQDGDDLLIVVQDSGPGIPEEIRGRLFQSFVTSGKKDGTGLGLAIVKKTMEEHGGSVACVPVQVGARFELRFPQKEQKKSEANGDKGANRARRPRPQRRTRRKIEEGVSEETRPV